MHPCHKSKFDLSVVLNHTTPTACSLVPLLLSPCCRIAPARVCPGNDPFRSILRPRDCCTISRIAFTRPFLATVYGLLPCFCVHPTLHSPLPSKASLPDPPSAFCLFMTDSSDGSNRTAF
ncbi:unnamed protein product [Protopolystoma xenopodis]|uniref:Uncharacterized protein n=1 Tax=Protopolystoma xenopodis TaxID=117903 RepID=A0A3S5FF20_9PLAT|nr:unnamed protein product [Protopolystoma xenopodis]